MSFLVCVPYKIGNVLLDHDSVRFFSLLFFLFWYANACSYFECSVTNCRYSRHFISYAWCVYILAHSVGPIRFVLYCHFHLLLWFAKWLCNFCICLIRLYIFVGHVSALYVKKVTRLFEQNRIPFKWIFSINHWTQKQINAFGLRLNTPIKCIIIR